MNYMYGLFHTQSPNMEVDRIADDFNRVVSKLMVHQRTATNIKDQILVIAQNRESKSGYSLRFLCAPLKDVTEKLQAISQLLPLQVYLRQAEVSDLLDSLLEACWKYAIASDDDFLREDIDAQRRIYKSDHEADMVAVKRLLRDVLRQKDIRQQVSKLTLDEVGAVRNAIYLERKSLAEQGRDSKTMLLFTDSLSRLNLGSTRAPNLMDLTGKIHKISSRPLAWGAVCGVWSGELLGKKVSLQSPVNVNHMVYKARYSEETVPKDALIWASFDHPNVMPLLGISRDLERLALVAPWMKNQSISYYVKANIGADRFNLITGLASGLCYLHSRSPPYVHCLLSGESVLVNESGQAIIGGFASLVFEREIIGSLRFLAPELQNRDDCAYTTASDVYSFAMTVFQIMTGSIPFAEIRTPRDLVHSLEKGERPARPLQKLVHHGLDSRLWSLISRCWAQDPNARPPMIEVVRELEKMRELPALDVRDLTGSITLAGDNPNEVRDCGAFGDIRLGLLEDVGLVALKSLNIKGRRQPAPQHTKRFFREASIWNSLKHQNVLPFLGTADPPGLSTCLVSPWMKNGNLINFMKEHPDELLHHIAKGIACGLAYLHAQVPHPVIHGDLRGVNVLISDEKVPLLCDFGLAVIVENLEQLPISSVLRDAGHPRWMAPELFVGDQQVLTTASDVWALGMVLLEMMTNDVPYSELKSPAQVIVEVHKGRLPSRPLGEDVDRRGLNDLWDFMMKCWERAPGDRPTAADALRAIEAITPEVK